MRCWIVCLATVGGVAAQLGLDRSRNAAIEPISGTLRARQVDHGLWRRQPGRRQRSSDTPQPSGTGAPNRVSPQGAGPSDPSRRRRQAGTSSERRSGSPSDLVRHLGSLRVTQSSGAESSSSYPDPGTSEYGRLKSTQVAPTGQSPAARTPKTRNAPQTSGQRSASSGRSGQASRTGPSTSPQGPESPRSDRIRSSQGASTSQSSPSSRNPRPTSPLYTFGHSPASPSNSGQTPGGRSVAPPDSNRGPVWLANERRVIQGYRTGATLPPNPADTLRDQQARAAGARSLEAIPTLKPLAQAARLQDDLDLRHYRKTLTSGVPMDHPTVMLAREPSRESSFKAYHLTRAYSNSHEGAAVTMANQGQFNEAITHRERGNRAYQRADLRLQQAEAGEMHWLSRAARGRLTAHPEWSPEARAKAVTIAVDASKQYKSSAEAYHRTFKDYQKVREEFGDSSSDESVKSTFNDVVPEARRAKARPKRTNPQQQDQRQQGQS